VPRFVDFVRDMDAWLATLGRVRDADSQIEAIGIRQRLVQMRDPSIDPERWARLASECARFRRDLELRRDVMPLALQGKHRSQDASKGGTKGAATKKRRAAAWRVRIKAKVARCIVAGKTDSNIGALLAAQAGKAARTVAGFAAQVRAKRDKKSAE